VLHDVLSVPYPAPVYLLAVLTVGMLAGTLPAILTSVAAFLLYDFLFVPPLHTLTVAEPLEWLNLLLFLAVAIAIGRLAALLAARAQEATERAREAEALFDISRALATGGPVEAAAPQVLERLVSATRMDRVWLTLGPGPGDERVISDSDPARPRPTSVWRVALTRPEPDAAPRWVRSHLPAQAQGEAAPATAGALYRVPMQVAGETLGSLWATRGRDRSEPDRSETRILSAAADQLGQAVRRDRLANEATAAEVARQSDQLKSALLDSVSHDLRTPLATIRAAAESLLDPEVEWSAQEQRAVLQSIDTEAERMSRLVRNLLDLSRIEGGALHPDLEPHDLNEIVEDTASRFRSTAKQSIVVHAAPELPPVLVDDLYLDEILSNLLENAVRHADNQIVVRAAQLPDLPFIELTVEDDGPGASDAALPRLFDKFYRGEQTKGAPRLSMGVGLTVVQGLVRAMGGEATARRSDLGGLAVEVRLPIATGPEPTESQRDGGPP
jgi:two-component system sensor histidine kinase KdpD